MTRCSRHAVSKTKLDKEPGPDTAAQPGTKHDCQAPHERNDTFCDRRLMTSQQALIGCGQNLSFQLGIPPTGVSSNGSGMVEMPQAIPIDVARISSISAGFKHSVFVIDGAVFACGENSSFQIGPGEGILDHPVEVAVAGEKVKMAACGQYYTVYLLESGQALVCGWRDREKPTELAGSHDFVYVAAGFDAPAAIDASGVLYVYGSDYREPPRRVEFEKPVFDVARGHEFVLALDVEGRVFGCGKFNGGKEEFVEIPSLRGVHAKRVYGCYYNAAVVADDGRVFMDTTSGFVQVEALAGEKVVSMDIGQHFSMYVTEDGKMFACGANTYGELMLGRVDEKPVPVTQSGFARVKIGYVKCGTHYTFALANVPAPQHFGAVHFKI